MFISVKRSRWRWSAPGPYVPERELPRGVNRQYNIVVIEDNLRRARVHAREMAEGEQFTRKSNGAFSEGFIELNWQPPVNAVGQPIDFQEQNTLRATLLAEDALRAHDPRRALRLLDGMPLPSGSHARKIAIQAALDIDEPVVVVKTVDEPSTIEEAVILVSALIRLNDLDHAADILETFPHIEPAIRQELRDKIEIKKVIKTK